MKRILRCFLFAPLLVGTASLSLSAHAQTYPTRPITLVVPFPAGAASDAAARALAPVLAVELGQPVVVQNVSGASGAIAVRKSIASAPDGYTLHFGTTNDVVLVPIVNAKAGYTASDLIPVGKTFVTNLTLVGYPDIPANNIDELTELLRRKPNSLSLAHPGVGTVQHLAGAAIASAGRFQWVNVPYRGSAPIATDLMAGHVQLAVMTMSSAAPLLITGRVKSFGLLRRERDASYPMVSTINEGKSISGIQFEQWNGVFAPLKTPPAIVQRLEAAVQAAIRNPQFRESQAKAGATTPNSTSAQSFAREMVADEAMYRAVAAPLDLRE